MVDKLIQNKTIATDGGPFLILPSNQVHKWGATTNGLYTGDEETDYEFLCEIMEDTAAVSNGHNDMPFLPLFCDVLAVDIFSFEESLLVLPSIVGEDGRNFASYIRGNEICLPSTTNSFSMCRFMPAFTIFDPVFAFSEVQDDQCVEVTMSEKHEVFFEEHVVKFDGLDLVCWRLTNCWLTK